MFKEIGIFFCVMVIILSVVPPAGAVEDSGSLAIKLDTGELPVTQGSVTILHAGTAAEGGYQLDANFGGGFVREEDMQSLELVQWLLRMVNKSDGVSKELDVDGWVSFAGLPDGLYLLYQREHMEGFYPFQPFLIELSQESGRNIQLSPAVYPIVLELPATGQSSQIFWSTLAMFISGLGLMVCFYWKRTC